MRVRGVSTLCALGKVASSALLYVVSATGSVNASFIADSAHEDWTGDAASLTLADGSMLHEFSAHTLSGNRSGAVLAVSFVPRFECKPIVSIRVLKSEAADFQSEVRVQFSIDDQLIEFDVLADEEDEVVRFSYHADTAQSRTLRNQIDVGSRAVAILGSADSVAAADRVDQTASAQADTGPAQSDVVNFSLLGSRKAIIAVEQACKDHSPAPYSAK